MLNPLPVVQKEVAFDLIAVLVLEGEVEQGLDADAAHLRADGMGGQGRVAAGIVGDGQRLDPAVRLRLAGKVQQAVNRAAA